MNNRGLRIDKEIFKYGPEPRITSIAKNRENAVFDRDVSDTVKVFINKRVNQETINTILSSNQTILNENTQTIINENVEVNIPKDLEVTSINLYNGPENAGQDRVYMNDNYFFNSTVVAANNNQFPNINQYNSYGFVTNKLTYIDNDLILKNKRFTFKNDGNFYIDNYQVTGRDKSIDEIYNNISPWSLDNNHNGYTFSKIAINDSYSYDYSFYVDGSGYIKNSYVDKITGNEINGTTLNIDGSGVINNLLVEDKLYISDRNNYLYVENNDLYFNHCKLNNCASDNVEFYLCFDYNELDLDSFEENIKSELTALDSTIDFTFLHFDFDTTVKTTISIRTDICISNIDRITVREQLKKIKSLIVDGLLYITVDSVKRKAHEKIYFLNEYYYFNEVSKSNAFKLVLRSDESSTNPIKTGQEVYLQNIDNKYLTKSYTFEEITSEKLLLEVHAYENNFVTENNTCIVSLKDGIKLEVLPPIVKPQPTDITDISNITDITGITSITSITSITTREYDPIIGTDYLTHASDFDTDTTWQNPGINTSILTDDIFTAENIEDYITDSNLYNKIYLVDERWLTYKENDGTAVFSFTLNDDHVNSKKFINGLRYCDTNIADYVFENNYQLETIEEHAKFMFENKHLPSIESKGKYIGSTTERNESILEELEKAHIYIYELNEKLKNLTIEISILKNKL